MGLDGGGFLPCCELLAVFLLGVWWCRQTAYLRDVVEGERALALNVVVSAVAERIVW